MINFSRDIFPSTVVTMGEITLISANSFAIPSLPVPAIPILGKPSTVLDERTNEQTSLDGSHISSTHTNYDISYPPCSQESNKRPHCVLHTCQIITLLLWYWIVLDDMEKRLNNNRNPKRPNRRINFLVRNGTQYPLQLFSLRD